MTQAQLDEWLDGNQICPDCQHEALTLDPPTMPLRPVNQRTGECALCRQAL